jgi:hypothetical protein
MNQNTDVDIVKSASATESAGAVDTIADPTADDKKELRSFLRDEYMFLQQTYDDFDRRLIVIKGWSVTIGSSAIVAGFIAHRYAWLGGIAAALLFWINEGMWKQLQFHYRPRIIDIEVAFQTNTFSQIKPFQLYHQWMQSFSTVAQKKARLGRIWSLNIVLVPHWPIIIICASLFSIDCAGISLHAQLPKPLSSPSCSDRLAILTANAGHSFPSRL